MIITIDGPTASGKSTIAKALARTLGYYYVYSGLLYRALSYVLINTAGYSVDTVAQATPEDINRALHPDNFVYVYDSEIGPRIIYYGQDITPWLKYPMIDQAASCVGTNKYAREQLNILQRKLGHQYNLIIDSRDAGAYVFVEAEIKLYLTADVVTRAIRWQKDQLQRGMQLTLQEAEEAVVQRDLQDSMRLHAPLQIPPDAIIIDSTNLTIEQTIDRIMEYIARNNPHNHLRNGINSH